MDLLQPRVDLRAARPVRKDNVRLMDVEWALEPKGKITGVVLGILHRRALDGEFYSQ